MSVFKKIFSVGLVFLLALVVTACGNDDKAKLQEAYDKLILTDLTEVEGDIELPMTGYHKATITWESSNTDVVKIEEVKVDDRLVGYVGKVTRPGEDAAHVTLKLTATIKVGKASTTKEFNVRVMKEPSRVTGNIETILKARSESKVQLTNVTVFGYVQEGYFVYDETGFMYVFTKSAPDKSKIKIGDKLNIKATFSIYYDQPELKDITEVEVVSSNNPLPTPVAGTVESIVNYDAKDRTVYSHYLTVEGTIGTKTSGSNTNYSIKDEAGNEVVVFYKSEKDAVDTIKANLGKKVKVNVVVFQYYSSSKEWRIAFLNHEGDISELQMTDKEKVDAAKSAVVIPNQTNKDINLPTELQGVQITWSSNNPDVLSNTGIINPQDENVEVTLTATFKLGNITETKTYKVTVLSKPVEGNKIINAINSSVGDIVTIEGVITALVGNSAYIQDETGGFYLYFDSRGNENIKVGNKVKVTGKRGEYEGLRQLVHPSKTETMTVEVIQENATLPAVKEFSKIADLIAQDLQGQLVKLTGLTVTKLSDKDKNDGYTVYATDGTNEIQIRIDGYTKNNNNYTESTTFTVGQIISVTGPVGKYKSDYQIMLVKPSDVTTQELTDAQKLASAKEGLSLGNISAVTSDLTLPAAFQGVNITWSSNNENVISNEGKVTRPAVGSQDATVNLTATLSIGNLTETKTFEVTVKAQVEQGQVLIDLFISEYIEGSSFNKAIEIYNGTGATVDLSEYKLVLYINGDETNTKELELSGTLENGKVLVVSHPEANDDIKNVTDIFDESKSVINFNGDDPIALVKNNEVIDIVGVFGKVQFGSDKTLIRKAEVTSGNKTYTESEWIVKSKDDSSNLGTH